MKKNIISISVIFLVLLSCNNSQPVKEDFVGTWQSRNGGLFHFKNDNTFLAEGLIGEKIFAGDDRYTGKKISSTGEWKIIKEQGRWRLFIGFTSIPNSNGKISTRLMIAERNTILFFFTGDPDDMIRYEFIKL